MINRFKKKTLALVLASVITVAGSFAEDNYKNTLMNIAIEKNGTENVGIVLETKKPYENEISTNRISADTYVITLPEVNSLSKTPNLSSGVLGIDIQTRPYTTNAKGYTRIKVKLDGIQNLSCSSKVYIESSDYSKIQYQKADTGLNKSTQNLQTNSIDKDTNIIGNSNKNTNTKNNISNNDQNGNKKTESIDEADTTAVKNTVSENTNTVAQPLENNMGQNSDNDYESFMLVCGILAVCAIVALCLYKGTNKMRDIAGSDTYEGKEAEELKPQKKSVQSTISKIDTKFPKYNYGTANVQNAANTEIEKVDVVDLDELFKVQNDETSSNKIEVNDYLEDFLQSFEFGNETIDNAEDTLEVGYDEEFYNKFIQSDDIYFSNNDILKIKALLNNEINEDAIKNMKKDVVTNPMQDSPEKRIEDLITTFTVYQGIKFTNKDIAAIRKIASVEIDKDFLADLTTDKKLTNKMEKEITAERPIINEPVKEQVLKVKDMLPDLSVEINNKAAYISKPSAKIDYVDKSYKVDVIKVDDLPDLEDALLHPEKYEKKPAKKFIADENVLLNSLTNVEIKPFDDGTRKFEVLNDFNNSADNNKDISEEIKADKETEISKETKVEEKVQISSPKTMPKTNTDSITKVRQTKDKSKIINATVETNKNCILEGISYSIISSVEFNETIGFHLAKIDGGYMVLAYVGNTVSELKQFDSLRNEKMSFRISETMADGTVRGLIKVGYNKFLVDINGSTIKHVMDL